MKVYLAGYMSGAVIDKCLEWRLKIREHYQNWKDTNIPYPIEFLDPFNGPELETIDSKGLKSSVPANAIFDGDFRSVRECDIVVANISTFGESRPMIGTFFELGWCTYQQKPFVIIASGEKNAELAEHHPFLGRASAVYSSVDELLEAKILNYFYKRGVGANYKYKIKSELKFIGQKE